MPRDARQDEADQREERLHPLPPSRPFLVGLVLVVVLLAMWLTRPYLGPVVFGLLMAFLLHPLYRHVEPHVRWPTLAATLMTLLVAILLVAPIVFLVWQTIGKVQGLLDLLQDPEHMRQVLQDTLAPFGISATQATELVSRGTQQIASWAAGQILPTIRYVIELLIALVVFFFVFFFAIRDGPAWVRSVKRFTPLPREDKDELFERARHSIWAIVMGTFVVAAIQAIVAGIGWWIFGFPDPLFWGFVMVLIGVFPFGAPFFVTVPASLIALAQGDIFGAIGLFAWTITVVALTDDLLRPLLVGKKAGVHPVLILVGMLGGITLFGIAGFLIGPLIFALLGPVLEVWASRRKERAEQDGQDPHEFASSP